MNVMVCHILPRSGAAAHLEIGPARSPFPLFFWPGFFAPLNFSAESSFELTTHCFRHFWWAWKKHCIYNSTPPFLLAVHPSISFRGSKCIRASCEVKAPKL